MYPLNFFRKKPAQEQIPRDLAEKHRPKESIILDLKIARSRLEEIQETGSPYTRRRDAGLRIAQLIHDLKHHPDYQIGEEDPNMINPSVKIHRPNRITLPLSDKEVKVLDDLSDAQELSNAQVLRQALKIYQMIHLRMKEGETMHFSGDKDRQIQFVFPGLGEGL